MTVYGPPFYDENEWEPDGPTLPRDRRALVVEASDRVIQILTDPSTPRGPASSAVAAHFVLGEDGVVRQHVGRWRN